MAMDVVVDRIAPSARAGVRRVAEPVVEWAAARRRELPLGMSVRRGSRHNTLVVHSPGISLGLAQPTERLQVELERVTRRAKEDLVEEIKREGGGAQGIVYLPYYALVRRSTRGADEMAVKRLSYEVGLRPHGEMDMLDAAVAYLRSWLMEDRDELAAFDQFARDVQRQAGR
jgi:hypothetical protein